LSRFFSAAFLFDRCASALQGTDSLSPASVARRRTTSQSRWSPRRQSGLLFRDRSDLRLLLGGQGYLRQLLGLGGVLHVVRRRLDLARHEAVNALGP